MLCEVSYFFAYLYIQLLYSNWQQSSNFRVRFFTKIQIRIFYPKTDNYFISLLKPKHEVLIQMIHNGGGFFSSYPKPDTLDTRSEALLSGYTAKYLQVTYLFYALSVPASKIFLEQALFLCLQKVDHVTNYCKRPINLLRNLK